MAKLTLLTLASGRSGTRYIADFFRHNVNHCYSTHEPYLNRQNPTLFGPAIYHNAVQDDQKLQGLIEQKRHFIQQTKQPVYLESNHALLKSAHRHFHTLADDIGLIQLRRNPLKVAKSEWLREKMIRRLNIPLHNYNIKGHDYFRWSLTGHEPIFAAFDNKTLSRYQFYLLQWLEIEQRAEQVIHSNQWHDRVFFIDVDQGLNADALKALLAFFALPARQKLKLNLSRNKTPFAGDNSITSQDHQQCEQLLPRLSPQNQARLTPYLKLL